MKQISSARCVCVVICAIFGEVVARSIPDPSASRDSTSSFLRNINKNFEVVEGPTEFLLPLAPLKFLLARHQKKDQGSGASPQSKSDLDYMVYGKVYLMKALELEIGDRSSAAKSSENVVPTTDKPSASDSISFPPGTTKAAKRQYQYKYWNTPKPSDYTNFSDGFTQSENRKIAVRSADREIERVPSSSSESSSTLEPAAAHSTESPSPNPENEFNLLDEEAVELLKKLVPAALTVANGISRVNESEQATPEEAILGSNTTNSDNAVIDIDNRFLINVPDKPMCPEGQRKGHRGACRPIFVHNPSPRDGIFAGRLTAPKVGATTNNNESDAGSHSSNFQLSALFNSLKKSLVRAADDAEIKLGQKEQRNEKDVVESKVNDDEEKA